MQMTNVAKFFYTYWKWSILHSLVPSNQILCAGILPGIAGSKKFGGETKPGKHCGPIPREKKVCLHMAKGLAPIHKMQLIHRRKCSHLVRFNWEKKS
jgi:hypothetical protein